jgi:hypothetical protein
MLAGFLFVDVGVVFKIFIFRHHPMDWVERKRGNKEVGGTKEKPN